MVCAFVSLTINKACDYLPFVTKGCRLGRGYALPAMPALRPEPGGKIGANSEGFSMTKFVVPVEACLKTYRVMDVEVDAKNPTDAVALVQIMIEKDEIDIDDMEEAGYDEPEIYIGKP